MDLKLFHFSNPEWMYGLLVIPVILLLYALMQPRGAESQQKSLEQFVDKHLLPHLLVGINQSKNKKSTTFSLIIWSMIWCLLMLAMAGPRWNYREFQTFIPEQKMIILLDLSKSMDAKDIEPSRMSRARLEIEEILRLNANINIGLIGFAAYAHMISPITEDHDNIMHLLPLLGSDLVTIQGSRLLPALKMAYDMAQLGSKNSNNNSKVSIVVLSDGGFQDSEAFKYIQELAVKNIIVHAIGIGTAEGTSFLNDHGQSIITRLDEDRMKELSRLGKGVYFPSHYSDRNAAAISNILKNQKDNFLKSNYTTKHWEERFYIFVLPILVIIISWYRRGFIFPFVIAIMFLPYTSYANDQLNDLTTRLLLNDQKFAKKLVEEDGDPEAALNYLEDPYRKGIAHYRSGNYDKAIEEFKKNNRLEVAKESLYNLGNALAMQNRLKEAIAAYQQAIDLDNNFDNAKYNLKLIEEILEQEEKKKQQNPDKDQGKEEKSEQRQEQDKGQEEEPDEKEEQNSNRDPDQKSDKDQEQNDNEDGNNDNNDLSKNKNDSKDDEHPNQPENLQEDEQSKNNEEDSENKKSDISNQNNDLNNQPEQQTNVEPNGNIDIDEWLNRISDDHKNFLRNQFYLESQRQMQSDKLNNNIKPW